MINEKLQLGEKIAQRNSDKPPVRWDQAKGMQEFPSTLRGRITDELDSIIWIEQKRLNAHLPEQWNELRDQIAMILEYCVYFCCQAFSVDLDEIFLTFDIANENKNGHHIRRNNESYVVINFPQEFFEYIQEYLSDTSDMDKKVTLERLALIIIDWCSTISHEFFHARQAKYSDAAYQSVRDAAHRTALMRQEMNTTETPLSFSERSELQTRIRQENKSAIGERAAAAIQIKMLGEFKKQLLLATEKTPLITAMCTLIDISRKYMTETLSTDSAIANASKKNNSLSGKATPNET